MSEAKFVKQEPQFAAFLAIDWADKKHAWCLQAMAQRSGKAESWSIVRKRWRLGWVSCAKDSPIVRSRWRWSNHEEL
jgi:hypothetical protein